MAQAGSGPKANARPLSPHLQVYSPQINMVMSIFHRITGAALYFGTIILVVWLLAVATGRGNYELFMGLLTNPIGLAVMVGYTWALMHHMLGGIRHLIWDTGRGFDLGTVNMLSWGTLVGSLSLTVLVWGVALAAKGGF